MTEARRAAAGRTGGKLLADALVAQGVTHAFCVPGESYLDLLDGLYSVRNRIQLVTCRFEAGAVHMAEAYGKLTGKPGVAIVTRGPGACHAAIAAACSGCSASQAATASRRSGGSWPSTKACNSSS